MRVYGTSPLYNYVELIFRSKRLFIGSIIIATLATVFFYIYRSGNYTASAIVLLTGTSTPTPEDKEEKGTIQYKLNMLNLDLRNPGFIKQALRDERLDQTPNGQPMSALDFDQFAKDVKDKITFAFENNALVISCTWPDDRAANIVNAIFGSYKRSVENEETIVSTTNTELMRSLVTDYTAKRNTVEKAVRDYQNKFILGPGLEPAPDMASNEYQITVKDLKRLEAEKELATMRLGLLQDQFKHTPKTYEESVVRYGGGKDPQYEAAKNALMLATNELTDMKSKYTENHPKVKAAQEKVDQLNKILKQYTASPAAAKPGPVMNATQAVNPAYLQLDNAVKQETISMKGLEKQVEQAQASVDEARRRAANSPDAQYNYRRMTDNLALFTTIQSSLASKLEEAKINEERDKVLKRAEIKLVVAPEAEKENKGAKGMLLLAAGPLIGLIIAFSFSLLAESMDHSLRTPLEVEKHLGKPVLAVLPRVNTGRDRSARRLGGDAARPTLPSS